MTDPLRIGGVPEHLNLPWHVAVEDGDFRSAGVEVEWSDEPGGTGAQVAALADGRLDMATVLTDGAVADIARGGPHRVIGWWTTTPMLWGVHVAGLGPVRTLADLEGTPIAVSRRGSGSHLMAYVQGARHGWSVEDGQFQVVGGIKGAREALASGRAAQFLWDRFMTQPLVDSGEFLRLDDEPTPWPAFVVVASDRALNERGGEVGRALNVARSVAAKITSDESVVPLVMDRHGLSAEAAGAWWERTDWALDGDISAADLGSVAAHLLSVGVLDETTDPGLLVADPSLLA